MRVSRLSRYGWMLLVVVALLFFVLPIVWILLGSLKPVQDVASNPPTYFFVPTLANYTNMFGQEGFGGIVVSSVVAVGAAVLFSVVISTPAAYVFTRQKFRGRKNLLFWLLSVEMFPPVAIVTPLYLTFLHLNLLGTIFPAIVSFTLFDIPFNIWMLRGFINEVPRSVEEAARVDGCSLFQSFFRVTLPLIRVGLLTSVLFMVVFNWGSYLIPTILASGNHEMLPAFVGSSVGSSTINWGQLVAGSIVMTGPLLVVAFFVQRYVVRGLTFGAIK